MDDYDDEEEFDPAEYEAMVALEQARLTDHALEAGWEMDAEVRTCDGCGETHMNEAWWWGNGFVYVDPLGIFVVSFDKNPASTELMAWECEELEEAVLLIDLLASRYSAVKMPDYPSEEDA